MHEAERSNKEDCHWVRREQAVQHTAKLSQSPCAIFERVFAEQGATRTMSAHFLISICRIGSPILYEPCRGCLDAEILETIYLLTTHLHLSTRVHLPWPRPHGRKTPATLSLQQLLLWHSGTTLARVVSSGISMTLWLRRGTDLEKLCDNERSFDRCHAACCYQQNMMVI